ncbi:B-cell receptor CD22-like protein [Labeo rohita]|uniref:B-cell receptor CD22-like protein n=1 Tax=Labeo rohita TaxID=84645 RepID=A0A498MN76_LABRO|nr:B-cell receptor CD22-like protein [Labeo rohita]
MSSESASIKIASAQVSTSNAITPEYAFLQNHPIWAKDKDDCGFLTGVEPAKLTGTAPPVTKQYPIKADRHVYYCGFTTNRGTWTGIPGAQLDVTGDDGLQDWGVNYSSSYVCALKGSTVKMSCTVKYPHDHQLRTIFWTKLAVDVTELPDLCSDPVNRERVHCVSEHYDTHSITLTSVTEADKHIFYCRFTTNTEGGKWTGVPGAQLDVTEADKHVYYCGFTTNRGTWTGIPGAQLDVTDNQTDDLYAKVKAKKPKRSGREKIEKDSGDVEEVQYASVHYFKNKDMNKTEETFEMQHPSDAKRSEDVIYSSVK